MERLNKEVKRRADVVGIFPNEASITRLIGAVLLEQNDEWLLQHRYMQIEGMAELTPDSPDRFGRQDQRPRKRWQNCQFLLSPVRSLRIRLLDPA